VIELSAGDAVVRLDPRLGGRIATLAVSGREIIVARGDVPGDPLGWGCYPMVPFAGRIRGGRLSFGGAVHDLPLRSDGHALHGTVDTVPWEILEVGETAAVLGCDLGPAWPFRGHVRHRVSLAEDGVRLELDLRADENMPAQVGWHPWFVRPATIRADFPGWLPRDGDGMPSLAPVVGGMPSFNAGVDDCFLAPAGPVRLETAGMDVSLASDCSHCVVYTGPGHGVCVEPKSGPPNQSEHAPLVLRAGENLRRWFEITWGRPPWGD
jgi:aldose 1-epimerase